MARAVRILSTSLVLAMVVAACSDDSDDTTEAVAEAPGDADEMVVTGDATLAPWTRVVEDDDVDALQLSGDTIVVPAGHPLADAAVDDVVVTGRTEQTPDGSSRRVTAVATEGDTVVLTTRQALLEETFQRSDVSARVPLTYDGVADAGGVQLGASIVVGDLVRSLRLVRAASTGITAADAEPAESELLADAALLADTAGTTPDDGTLDVELEETDTGLVLTFDELLHDGDGDEGTTDDQITLAGTVTVDIDVLLDVDIDDFQLEHAIIALSGVVATNLVLDAEQAGSFSDEKDLIEIRFTPILVPVGPVTVPVQPTLPIQLGWDGEFSLSGQTSLTTTTRARAGVEYDEGWQVLKEFDPDHDFAPPAFEDGDPATAELYAGPSFKLRIWEELVDASIAAHGTVAIETLGAAPWVCLYGGLRAPADIEVLGSSVASGMLFEERTLLAHEGCAPGSTDPGSSDGGSAPPRALPEPVAPVEAYSRTFDSCDGGSPVGEYGQVFAAMPDGGVLIGSRRSTSDTWLTRLDAAGDVVWSRTYPVTTLGDPGGIVAFPDGSAVVGLDLAHLMFVDPFGDVTAVVKLDGLGFISTLVAAPDGDGLLVGGSVGTNGVLVRTDPDGTVRWAQQYSGAKVIAGAAPRPGGGWSVALTHGKLFTADDTGAVQAAVELTSDDPGAFVFDVSAGAAPDGGLGVAVMFFERRTGMDVLRLDAGLGLIGGAGLTAADRQVGLEPHAAHVLDDGSVVAAATVIHTGDGQDQTSGVLLTRLTASGSPSWTVEYGGTDAMAPVVQHRIGALGTLGDGGLFAAGTSWELAGRACGAGAATAIDAAFDNDLTGWDLWALKLPTTGLLSPSGGSPLRVSGFDTAIGPLRVSVTPSDVGATPLSVTARPVDPVTSTALTPTDSRQAP